MVFHHAVTTTATVTSLSMCNNNTITVCTRKLEHTAIALKSHVIIASVSIEVSNCVHAVKKMVCLLTLAVSFLFLSHTSTAAIQSVNADATPYSDLSSGVCPIWTTQVNESCICGNNLDGKVNCDDNTGVVSIANCFCMTTGELEDIYSPMVGACLYTCTLFKLNHYRTDGISNNTCGPYKRTGRMCGKCKESYGIPVYSYSSSCVKCTDYKHNWLLYIAVAFVPLTIFYFFIMAFRISATSGWLNGYVLLSQMITIRRMLMLVTNNSKIVSDTLHLTDKYSAAILTIWNLDFLRSIYPPFCLHPHLSALHVLMLDYLVALYPLALIMLTYLLVKLHDRYSLVSWLWRPFYKCFHAFRKEWEISSSLIGAFATFYLLSYVKVLNVTAEILAPIRFQNMTGSYTGYFMIQLFLISAADIGRMLLQP